VPGNLGERGNKVSEWNVYADPGAARDVLAAGLPVLLVPLDATNRVKVDAAFQRDVQRVANPLGRVVSELLATATERINAGLYYAWDPLAAVALLDRSVIRSEPVSISVRLSPPEGGRTARDPKGTAIEVALGADAKRFTDRFVTALAGR
jgi:inosine-uridine nucleoside N-ribohydrolase